MKLKSSVDINTQRLKDDIKKFNELDNEDNTFDVEPTQSYIQGETSHKSHRQTLGGVSWFDKKSGDNFTNIQEANVDEESISPVMDKIQTKKEAKVSRYATQPRCQKLMS